MYLNDVLENKVLAHLQEQGLSDEESGTLLDGLAFYIADLPHKTPLTSLKNYYSSETPYKRLNKDYPNIDEIVNDLSNYLLSLYDHITIHISDITWDLGLDKGKYSIEEIGLPLELTYKDENIVSKMYYNLGRQNYGLRDVVQSQFKYEPKYFNLNITLS